MIKAGEKGVDFSFARPPAHRLLDLGYTFIVGYISVPPASPAKNISKVECETYIAAGIKVLLVWEMSATRASLGAAYGKADGNNAKNMALARGYPTDIPILVADDTNTTATNIEAHVAYMRAFAENCAPYPIGIYGDTDILGRCIDLWRIGWLPNAWSWSGPSKAQAEATARALGVHVLQRTGFYIDGTWAVDPNEAIRDLPAWGQPDPQLEDDVPRFFDNLETRTMPYGEAPPFTAVFISDITKRNIGSEEYAAWGNPARVSLTNSALDAIPDAGTGAAWDEARVSRIETVEAQLNESIGRVGQVIGDIQKGLGEAADARA